MQNLSIELWRIQGNEKVFVTDFDFLKEAKDHLKKVQNGFEAIEKGSTRMEDKDLGMILYVNSDIFVGEYKIMFVKNA